MIYKIYKNLYRNFFEVYHQSKFSEKESYVAGLASLELAREFIDEIYENEDRGRKFIEDL